MISVLSVCCCALLNFESFIHGHFLSFFFFYFLNLIYSCFVGFVVVVVLCGCGLVWFPCSFK